MQGLAVGCGFGRLPDPCGNMWSHAMKRRMGIRELRDTLTATVRRVRAGESIEITHDGEPVALLSPLPRGRLDRLIASGEVSPGEPLDGPFRPRPAKTGKSASEALERDRSER